MEFQNDKTDQIDQIEQTEQTEQIEQIEQIKQIDQTEQTEFDQISINIFKSITDNSILNDQKILSNGDKIIEFGDYVKKFLSNNDEEINGEINQEINNESNESSDNLENYIIEHSDQNNFNLMNQIININESNTEINESNTEINEFNTEIVGILDKNFINIDQEFKEEFESLEKISLIETKCDEHNEDNEQNEDNEIDEEVLETNIKNAFGSLVKSILESEKEESIEDYLDIQKDNPNECQQSEYNLDINVESVIQNKILEFFTRDIDEQDKNDELNVKPTNSISKIDSDINLDLVSSTSESNDSSDKESNDSSDKESIDSSDKESIDSLDKESIDDSDTSKTSTISDETTVYSGSDEKKEEIIKSEEKINERQLVDNIENKTENKINKKICYEEERSLETYQILNLMLEKLGIISNKKDTNKNKIYLSDVFEVIDQLKL